MPPISRKPKKRKNHFSSFSDSSASCTDGESSSSSSENERTSNTWKMTKAEDVNSWKLPRKLDKCFTGNQEHYTDAGLKDNILEACQSPKTYLPPHTLKVSSNVPWGGKGHICQNLRHTGPLSCGWMMVVCHAMSAVTFHRRRAVLTSIAKNRKRAHRWDRQRETQLYTSCRFCDKQGERNARNSQNNRMFGCRNRLREDAH